MKTTISCLIAQVENGGEQFFEGYNSAYEADRYFAVHQNCNYFPWPEWHNTLPLEEAPWAGSRQKERIAIFVLPEPNVTFAEHSSELVDFYKTGCQAFFISDRLASLIERLDPGSIDRRRIVIKAEDRDVSINIAMSRRNIEAVDAKATNILVKGNDYGSGRYIRKIRFPNGVKFDVERLQGYFSFTDIDVSGWFWSQELINAARAEAIRGLYTTTPGVVTSVAVERL